jgi:hypothetical protein
MRGFPPPSQAVWGGREVPVFAQGKVVRLLLIRHAWTVKQGRVFVAALGRKPETVPLHAT